MRPEPSWLGKTATVYSGHDWRKEHGPMARGRVIAYIEGPSVMVEDENGHRSTWPTSLPVDLSDPEPEKPTFTALDYAIALDPQEDR